MDINGWQERNGQVLLIGYKPEGISVILVGNPEDITCLKRKTVKQLTLNNDLLIDSVAYSIHV